MTGKQEMAAAFVGAAAGAVIAGINSESALGVVEFITSGVVLQLALINIYAAGRGMANWAINRAQTNASVVELPQAIAVYDLEAAWDALSTSPTGNALGYDDPELVSRARNTIGGTPPGSDHKFPDIR